MDKKEFLNLFNEYDKNFISNIYEDIELCKSIDIPICTKEFVTPDIYVRLMEKQNKLGVNLLGFGMFEECERRVLCFSTDKSVQGDFDIELIKIKNESRFKALTHKDYLGAIMSLGIKRELFGDLIVKGDECYLPISKTISSYIVSNLVMVGRCPCTVDKVNFPMEEIPKISFEEKNMIVTSLRLDNIISSICNISRTKANTMIQGGLVKINYLIVNKKDKVLQVNDTLTVKGHGKFKIKAMAGETAKGRLKIVVGKYI